MIVWTSAAFGVLYACVLYFCISTCSAQLSMFHMERRYRKTLIIIIVIIIIVIVISVICLLPTYISEASFPLIHSVVIAKYIHLKENWLESLMFFSIFVISIF